MTIKPFAIQGADLTLGGVNLQAGTTGVVIPGVTQATSYKVEEVNDTGDQTYSNFPLDTEGTVVVIDAALYDTIVAQGDERHFADYTVTTDGEGYIDEIQVNGQGAYTGVLAGQAQSFDMYAYVGAGSASDRPLVPQDWITIPFRPRMRAGAVEVIGGGNGGNGLVERTVNYPGGASGDTRGTMALTPGGDVYVCTADWVNYSGYNDTYELETFENFLPGQTGNVSNVATILLANVPQEILYILQNLPIVAGNWSVNMDNGDFGGDRTCTDVLFNNAGNLDFFWPYRSGVDPIGIPDGSTAFISYNVTVPQPNIWRQVDNSTMNLSPFALINNTGDLDMYTNGDHSDQYAEVWLRENNEVLITADGETTKWHFKAGGDLVFPDGSIQTTAYTGQAGGGSGELYIMANVDGNIITSTDGQTWGDPIASGVPVNGGGPGVGIGKVEIHGGVIVYTRTDEGNADGVRGSGLYYSTEIGTATLCSGTDADPSGELFWNEVHFFHETDTWVAVGYWQYGGVQGDSRKPIYAYSTTGISWTVKYVDSNFVTDHNTGNWSWEMTDVVYSAGASSYLFFGKVGGDNHAGVFITNDLNATLDATTWIDVNLNARYARIFSASLLGGPPEAVLAVSADISAVWSAISDYTNTGNWYADFSGPNYGWYQSSMIDAVGYVPDIAEIATNGSWAIITTADGQVAVPGAMTMNVTVPLPYTATINDISRTDGTIGNFTVSPTVGSQNNNWTTFDQVVNSGDDSFHIVIDGTGTLVTCDEVASAKKHNIGDVITLYGQAFGGVSGVDDIVITVTDIIHPITTIQFTGEGIANNSGEKITITGATTADASEPGTSDQSYNGTYYVKRIDHGGDPATYELYTDQACTTPWDTSTYWPVNGNTGTLTWSHGQFFDAAGAANSYFYIGNDDEQIFRSTDSGATWVQQADLTGQYLNDFAYGTWGSGASSLTELTVQSPFVVDFFGPEVYFIKTNYGSEVDNIDTDLSITRGSEGGGIYNSALEQSYNGGGDYGNGQDGSPMGTQWNDEGWGNLSNVKNRYYNNWYNIVSGGINTQGREFVMHDTNNDKYYAIKFLTWTGNGNGGGFSYVRKLINTACWFDREDGDDSGQHGDQIGPGLTIDRGSDQAIYNSEDEGGWNDNVSPSGTLWNAEGWSDLTNVTTRHYIPFYDVARHAVGKSVQGIEFVMKDTINNKYYAIKFYHFAGQVYGSGPSWPGFGYTRREIDLTKVSSNVKFADGTIQTTAVTEERLGVLPQKIVENNGYNRFLTPDDIGKHLFVTGSGTTIVISDSVRYRFPVGSVITIINKSGGTININKDNDEEGGTIFGSAQNATGSNWYVNDSGSGNMVTLIKIGQYCDDGNYSQWMIAGTDIGTI